MVVAVLQSLLQRLEADLHRHICTVVLRDGGLREQQSLPLQAEAYVHSSFAVSVQIPRSN